MTINTPTSKTSQPFEQASLALTSWNFLWAESARFRLLETWCYGSLGGREAFFDRLAASYLCTYMVKTRRMYVPLHSHILMYLFMDVYHEPAAFRCLSELVQEGDLGKSGDKSIAAMRVQTCKWTKIVRRVCLRLHQFYPSAQSGINKVFAGRTPESKGGRKQGGEGGSAGPVGS